MNCSQTTDLANQMPIRPVSLLTALLLACLTLPAHAAEGQAPVPSNAAAPLKSLPQDRHEGLTVSVDAYTDPERAKAKFGKSADPLSVGILPVEVFLHNETSRPIHINLSTIQLTVRMENGERQDVDRLAPATVASAIAHPQGPEAPKARRFPIGVETGGDKKTEKVEEALVPLSLDSDVVPPQSTIHGFMYFDLDRDISLADGASFYLPDASTIPGNQALMFFEVPLKGGSPQ
jgi:hypothetical protein